MNKKRLLAILALGCVACCALPLLPMGVLAFSGLAAVRHELWLCGPVVLVAALITYVQMRRKGFCATDCGCKAGNDRSTPVIAPGDHPRQ